MAQTAPQDFGRLPVRRAATADEARVSAEIVAEGRAVAAFFGALIARGGMEITVRQAGVLAMAVSRPGEQTVASLAAALNMSKPAVSRSLDRLRNLGLAHRRISERDKRIVLIDPTAAGAAWVRAAAHRLGQG